MTGIVTNVQYIAIDRACSDCVRPIELGFQDTRMEVVARAGDLRSMMHDAIDAVLSEPAQRRASLS